MRQLVADMLPAALIGRGRLQLDRTTPACAERAKSLSLHHLQLRARLPT